MEGEIQLFSSKKTTSEGKDAIMTDECLKSASEIVAVEPIDHVSTVTSTKSYCSSHVNLRHVLLDPVHDVDQVVVRCTTPVFPVVATDKHKIKIRIKWDALT